MSTTYSAPSGPGWKGDALSNNVFDTIRGGFRSGVSRDPGARVALLKRIRDFILRERDALTAALFEDLGKSETEALMCEIMPVLQVLNLLIRKTVSWSAPRRAAVREGAGYMKKKNTASRIYTGLIMLFLFAPIAILLFFSFNEAKSLSVFSGFSLYWYRELFRDSDTLGAVRNTLLLAVSAALISTVMGTAAAVGIDKLRSKYIRSVMDSVTNIPMINPDIITGISLMLMFVFVGRLFGAATSLSFWTMLIAHVTFCLPYVILQVLPKLQQMDRSLPEAAMDLGCTPLRAFLKVEIPEIMPGVITGMIMAFTLSLDDFVISYFTAGNGFQTLPIRIYNMTKKTVTPKMYALATIIFFVILALLILSNTIEARDEEAEAARKNRKRSKKAKEVHK